MLTGAADERPEVIVDFKSFGRDLLKKITAAKSHRQSGALVFQTERLRGSLKLTAPDSTVPCPVTWAEVDSGNYNVQVQVMERAEAERLASQGELTVLRAKAIGLPTRTATRDDIETLTNLGKFDAGMDADFNRASSKLISYRRLSNDYRFPPEPNPNRGR